MVNDYYDYLVTGKQLNALFGHLHDMTHTETIAVSESHHDSIKAILHNIKKRPRNVKEYADDQLQAKIKQRADRDIKKIYDLNDTLSELITDIRLTYEEMYDDVIEDEVLGGYEK